MHVFTYGSLMFDPVWSQVVRGRYRSASAELAGFQRWCVRGEQYPGLWAAAGGHVSGRLYYDLDPADMSRLDAFEGDYYQRQSLSCEVGTETINAEVYLFKSRYRHLLSDQEWQPDAFERHGLQPFIQRYRGFLRR